MAKVRQINHATLIVRDLEVARHFYEHELGLEPLPTFNLDFPAQFYRINDYQQLHITEWHDETSFRGHICLQITDFNAMFYRMRELGAIDITPWGKVRRLPDGSMQLFVRDPSHNLIELSAPPGTPVDATIFDDDLVEAGTSVYVSNRNDGRGLRGEGATLYQSEPTP
jgi:catechol 2,3-dioxygenase-like lactoylglutathione lyase family enzyme